MTINVFHVPIMGFTQAIDRRSGMENLWLKLREVLTRESHSLIPPQRWLADFDGLAEFIHRNIDPAGEVRIYAYSWGCGRGALALTKALNRRGVAVSHMVLADPVFHSWLRVWRGIFHARLNPPIVYPQNVQHVASFAQRQNTPQGTEIKLKHPAGIVEEPILLQRSHAYMDDAPEFHTAALAVAKLPPPLERNGVIQ